MKEMFELGDTIVFPSGQEGEVIGINKDFSRPVTEITYEVRFRDLTGQYFDQIYSESQLNKFQNITKKTKHNSNPALIFDMGFEDNSFVDQVREMHNKINKSFTVSVVNQHDGSCNHDWASSFSDWKFPTKKDGCQHDWVNYQGFTENYQYCKKCDEKKELE